MVHQVKYNHQCGDISVKTAIALRNQQSPNRPKVSAPSSTKSCSGSSSNLTKKDNCQVDKSNYMGFNLTRCESQLKSQIGIQDHRKVQRCQMIVWSMEG